MMGGLNLNGNTPDEIAARQALYVEAAAAIVSPVYDEHSPDRMTGIAISDGENSFVVADGGLAARIAGRFVDLSSKLLDSQFHTALNSAELEALTNNDKAMVARVQELRDGFRAVGGKAPDMIPRETE